MGPGRFLLGLCSDAAGDGLVRGPLRPRARAGRRFPAVEPRHRDNRPRRGARGAGRDAAADGRWRVHVLPERTQSAVAKRGGDAARSRYGDNAVRRRGRSGHWNAAGRTHHAPLWVAGNVPGDGTRIAALADFLASLDAESAQRGATAAGRRRSAVPADSAAARAMGRDDGHVLLELRLLFRIFVASAVSRERARTLSCRDGAHSERVLCVRRSERAAHRMAARQVGLARGEPESGVQDRARPQQRWCRPLPHRKQRGDGNGRRRLRSCC